MNIRIDYYSGTGGTQKVAEKIGDHLRSQGCNVYTHKIIRNKFIPESTLRFDYYIVLFAVHSFNAPTPVFEWVSQINGDRRKCAVIAVSGAGETITNTACRRKLIQRLEKQNFDVIYENMVRMPNNWMKVPKKEKCDKILKQCPVQASIISEDILNQKARRKKPLLFDILISALGEGEKRATSKFGLGIRTLDSCNGCGHCASRCSSSNIQIIDKKAIFSAQCDMCLACIYGCPRKALVATVGAFQIDKNGYDLNAFEKRRKELIIK